MWEGHLRYRKTEVASRLDLFGKTVRATDDEDYFTCMSRRIVELLRKLLGRELLTLNAEGDFIGTGREKSEDALCLIVKSRVYLGVGRAVGQAVFLELNALKSAKPHKALRIFTECLTEIAFLEVTKSYKLYVDQYNYLYYT